MVEPLTNKALMERYSRLRQLYWQLRSCRPWDRAMRERWYRRIRAEKLRLRELGVRPIELHLWCRFFVDPRNQNYRARLNGYYGGNVASRFSTGFGWAGSLKDGECQSRHDAVMERLKAKLSVNNVYYVKYKNNRISSPDLFCLRCRPSPLPPSETPIRGLAFIHAFICTGKQFRCTRSVFWINGVAATT